MTFGIDTTAKLRERTTRSQMRFHFGNRIPALLQSRFVADANREIQCRFGIAATRCRLFKTFDPVVVVRIAIAFLEPPVVIPFGVLVYLACAWGFALS